MRVRIASHMRTSVVVCRFTVRGSALRSSGGRSHVHSAFILYTAFELAFSYEVRRRDPSTSTGGHLSLLV